MSGLFPLVFTSQEAYLLTAVGLGFLFGFSLERAGFANARKLAAQFYLYDMTVFKVMFTAILVAMTGVYALAGAGVVDLSRMWINPTFMWAEVIGGFLLGVGFITSGLCPGTSVVSMASGRWDGLVTFAGIGIGTALFAVAVDWFPWLAKLYERGGEVSVLPALLHLPTPLVVAAVVAMAAAAFVGAEKVEKIFAAKYAAIESAPRQTPRTPRIKLALAGTLGVVVVASLAFAPAPPDRTPIPMTALAPADLADAILAHDPALVILDLRAHAEEAGIPGAYAVNDSTASTVLASAVPTSRVVVYDETGARHRAPGTWPRTFAYSYVGGGLAAWRADVLTPKPPASFDAAARARAARQQQVAAYFSGGSAAAMGAPPAPAAGGGKKRAGGC